MKRLKWIVLGVLAVVVVIAAVVGVFVYRQLNKDTIKLGKTHGEMVFISDRAGTWDVFLLRPDGTLLNLTDQSKGHEYFQNFTFDGKMISFYSSDSGEFAPGVVRADGSDFRTMSWAEAFVSVVKDGRTDNDPAWAPGGDQMVWSKMKGLSVDLYMANSDGSDEHSLVDKGPTDSAPAWSPDGSKLAFTADKSDQQNIYVLDMESGEAAPLTEGSWDFQPVWSEDGSTILFARDVDDSLPNGNLTLYVMNADGSDLHALAEDEEFKGDRTYSPYGGQVAFMSNEDGFWHIYVMDADGSNVRRVTEGDSNNLFPAWRPVPASQDEAEIEATPGE